MYSHTTRLLSIFPSHYDTLIFCPPTILVKCSYETKLLDGRGERINFRIVRPGLGSPLLLAPVNNVYLARFKISLALFHLVSLSLNVSRDGDIVTLLNRNSTNRMSGPVDPLNKSVPASRIPPPRSSLLLQSRSHRTVRFLFCLLLLLLVEFRSSNWSMRTRQSAERRETRAVTNFLIEPERRRARPSGATTECR